MDKGAAANADLLVIEHLSKCYGDKKALEDINFILRRGETLGLLGLNGAGKTTLMEIIAGARKQSSGQFFFAGDKPDGESVKQRISLQPQGSSFFKYLTVKECIDLWRSLYPKALDTEEVIRLVGLESSANVRTPKLSGGQKQRLRLALAVVGGTELILLDEPTVGLDPVGRDAIWDVIKERKESATTLLSTQLMDEAAELCDRVLIIADGKIVAAGTPGDLIQEFVGEKVVIITLPDQDDSLELNESEGVTWVRTKARGRGSELHVYCHDYYSARPRLEYLARTSGGTLHVRNSTLEDAFFRVVGKDGGSK